MMAGPSSASSYPLSTIARRLRTNSPHNNILEMAHPSCMMIMRHFGGLMSFGSWAETQDAGTGLMPAGVRRLRQFLIDTPAIRNRKLIPLTKVREPTMIATALWDRGQSEAPDRLARKTKTSDSHNWLGLQRFSCLCC